MSNRLLEMAQYNLEKLAEMEKDAFEPMMGAQQQPQQAPVDPAAGGAPVDPAMAAPQGAVDPAAGGVPAVGSPPPATAPAAPAPSAMDPAMMDAMIQAVRQVMQESGGQQGGGAKAKGGQDVEERLGSIEAALAQVLEVLNLASPDKAVADAITQSAKPKADVMSAGSGSAADASAAMPPMGLMDPNAGAAMGELQMPNSVGGVKMGAKTPSLAEALRNARRR